jgi:Lon protease-like protein
MSPLGSVLFPYMPLRLQVIEERHRIMLANPLKLDQARFGVLIEHRHEVGAARRCPESDPLPNHPTDHVKQLPELICQAGTGI